MLRDLRYFFQPLTPVNETNSQNKFDFHLNENPTGAELLRSSLAPLPYPVISLETKRERERERAPGREGMLKNCCHYSRPDTGHTA